MRVLVYPHSLAIGGSQINAIDLAAGVAEAGHDVVVYGIPGPLVAYIEERGLRFIPARRLRYRPAPSRIAQLATIAAKEQLDLIHAYEWPPCLDAYYGASLVLGVPLLCTVLSMSVMPYVPTSVPLIMGTEELTTEARKVQRADVWTLEPPIDVERDHPGVDGSAFRRAHGVRDDQLLIVTVSRLALDLKIDALVRAIVAAELLAGRHDIRVILVGEGAAHDGLLERANAVNARCGREVVTLAGPELDPRPAYAAADVVVGMGSSALRALSIGRALVVQGENGFSEVFDSANAHTFVKQGFWQGLYGQPEPDPSGGRRLADQLESLLIDPERRESLGRYGREVVTTRFSLERAVGIQLDIYRQVLRNPPMRRASDVLRSGALALKLEVDNHDPRRKRERRQREREVLAAACHGPWPPASA